MIAHDTLIAFENTLITQMMEAVDDNFADRATLDPVVEWLDNMARGAWGQLEEECC